VGEGQPCAALLGDSWFDQTKYLLAFYVKSKALPFGTRFKRCWVMLMDIMVLGRINDNFRELLEAGPKPTVAAISGMALGGGLETAMACNARLASPGWCHTHAQDLDPKTLFKMDYMLQGRVMERGVGWGWVDPPKSRKQCSERSGFKFPL
jgi:hypothetical protein